MKNESLDDPQGCSLRGQNAEWRVAVRGRMQGWEPSLGGEGPLSGLHVATKVTS